MIRDTLEFTSYAIEIICGLIFDRIMNLLVWLVINLAFFLGDILSYFVKWKGFSSRIYI